MEEPMNTVFKATADSMSIKTSSGSGIHLHLPFEGDIEDDEDEQTYNQTFTIPNEGLTIKLDKNDGIHTVDIKKVENGITVIYHETASEEVEEAISLILSEIMQGVYHAEGDYEVGDIEDEETIFLTAITHEDNMLKFITSDGNGFSMTFKHGDAVPVVPGDYDLYDIKKDGVKIGEIEIGPTVDVRLHIIDEDMGKYKIDYIEGITEELKAALIAILNTPAAVGGRRRRHRKTRRRQQKKKRRHTRR